MATSKILSVLKFLIKYLNLHANNKVILFFTIFFCIASLNQSTISPSWPTIQPLSIIIIISFVFCKSQIKSAKINTFSSTVFLPNSVILSSFSKSPRS